MEQPSFPEVPPEMGLPAAPKANHLDKFLTIDKLKPLNLNFYDNHYKSCIQELRKKEGLGVALKLNTDRLLVNMVGSQVMDDVITGRCYTIQFEDFMKHRKRTKLSGLVKIQGALSS